MAIICRHAYCCIIWKKHSPMDGRHQLNRIIEENQWIKIYFSIYGVALAIGINYMMINDICG